MFTSLSNSGQIDWHASAHHTRGDLSLVLWSEADLSSLSVRGARRSDLRIFVSTVAHVQYTMMLI